MGRWIEENADRWEDGQKRTQIDGKMDRRDGRQRARCIEEKADRWEDGKKRRQIEGKMDRRKGRQMARWIDQGGPVKSVKRCSFSSEYETKKNPIHFIF